ncbi:MAG: Dam family site-specific DNA-(adenine-N6)-methyltransferase [Chloroflexi bacterium]|nr:Dam family site-specific DNA-(adenine-N6)-methyltransferase [Chloroflexota bacterium]
MNLLAENLDDRPGCPPLLKWPGGKRAVLSQLLPLIPRTAGRYIEPFFGGGAVFFTRLPDNALLSDNNVELIECYIQVRDNPSSVISHLSEMKNSEEVYYRIRESHPSQPASRAARLIYLATLAFNGIYRTNLNGRFNVPYGHKTHINPCATEKIYAVSRGLQSATLLACDFAIAVTDARKGDIVYMDPPYTVAHRNNGFIKYNAKMFTWDDQVRLADVCERLVHRGCRVIISNADHPAIHQLYSRFNVKKVERVSRVASSASFRGRIQECVFHSGD